MHWKVSLPNLLFLYFFQIFQHWLTGVEKDRIKPKPLLLVEQCHAQFLISVVSKGIVVLLLLQKKTVKLVSKNINDPFSCNLNLKMIKVSFLHVNNRVWILFCPSPICTHLLYISSKFGYKVLFRAISWILVRASPLFSMTVCNSLSARLILFKMLICKDPVSWKSIK